MLLGREKEFDQIEKYLKDGLSKNGQPLSLYIGGTSGTGKTATLRLIIDKLNANKLFNFAIIDCFECSTAIDLYRIILEQLHQNSSIAKNQLLPNLEKFFLESEKPIIILLDEIDQLSLTNSYALLYKAFEWPTYSKGNVITIGISNSLDLVERLLPKLKANKHPPKVITYSPYTKLQLVRILEQKLGKEGVNSSAIELCARKVSALTGDVRRAFHIANSVIQSLKNESELESNITSKENLELNFTTAKKKNACSEVLKEIDKVYASPLFRSHLPLHPKILLATFMRMINKTTLQTKKRSNSNLILRDKLVSAYNKVCNCLSYSALNIEELGNAFAVLESQGMISQKSRGFVSFEVELEVARCIINDNAILSEIENVNLD